MAPRLQPFLGMKMIHAALVLMTSAAVGAAGCSSGSKRSEEVAAQAGPHVHDVRSEPGTIDMNSFLQAKRPHHFSATVQDLSSQVEAVRIRLKGMPIEVPMSNIGGDLWRGEFSSQQLKRLAVSGKTMEYEGQVIATDRDGNTRVSEKTVKVKVKSDRMG